MTGIPQGRNGERKDGYTAGEGICELGWEYPRGGNTPGEGSLLALALDGDVVGDRLDTAGEGRCWDVP